MREVCGDEGVLEQGMGWADRLGVIASAACVVHCLLMPVVLSASAVLAHALPGEERTHRMLAVAVALLGTVALLSGFRRHRRWQVLGWMVCGVGCIAGAAWWGDRLPSHAWEVGVTMAGSVMMVLAHRLNHTFCRSCVCVPRAE